MSPRLLRFYFPLCLCLPLCLCFASESLAPSVFVVPHYSVTDLGILPAGKYVYVTGINNLGQVVGWVKFGQISVEWQDAGPRSPGGPSELQSICC